MKNSELKITLAQLNYKIADFEANTFKITEAISTAKKHNSDLIVFTELAICGYPPLDLLEQSEFYENVEKYLNLIKSKSENIGIIIGAPYRNKTGKGKPFFNSAYFFFNKKCIYIAHKSLIPNYDVFDEYRYFEPANTFNVVDFQNHKIAITICEDLWDKAQTFEYRINPIDELLKYQPDIIINISASPFDFNKDEKRNSVLKQKARKAQVPIFYVNAIGAQTDLIFDGCSKVFDSKGRLVYQMKAFEEDICTFELNEIKNNKTSFKIKQTTIEKIHSALILGIKDFFRKNCFKTAVVGLSGGIDSAVVAVLAAEALGKENIQTIYLPSRFSSNQSFEDAKKLAETNNLKFDVIDIDSIFQIFIEKLKPFFENLPFNITEENIQSRIRAIILMAFSNKFGHILLNTSNKSEIATGYGTLYGDMCGSLSVIGDLYKTQVYELANYLNRDIEKIPLSIIKKEPTAELKPDQKDSDTLPPYEVLDKILYQYVELNKSIKTISKQLQFDENLVKYVVKLIHQNEFKRFQAPPILRISTKSFGIGRRFPLVAKY